MKFTTIFASAAALVATALGADESTSVMTMEYSGLTKTIPVGLDVSSTETVPGWAVTGTAVIYSGLAVITDSASIYAENIKGDGELFRDSKAGTNIINGVTIIDGKIQGVNAADATDSSSETNAATETATTTASGSSSSPSSGAVRLGGGQFLAMAGLGAAAIVVAM